MTAMERHAQALTKAREWRARVAAQVQIDVEDLEPLGSRGWWHATVVAPHPGDSPELDSLRAGATGTSEAGARELALLEVFGLATRYFLAADDPAVQPFTHDVDGAKAVAASVVDAGGQRPKMGDVDKAFLALKVEHRNGPMLVGEVAAMVLERQRCPVTEVDHPEQGRLSV